MDLLSKGFVLVIFYIQSAAIKPDGFRNTGKIISCLPYCRERKYTFNPVAAILIRQCPVNNVPVLVKIIETKAVPEGLITPDNCGYANGHSDNV